MKLLCNSSPVQTRKRPYSPSLSPATDESPAKRIRCDRNWYDLLSKVYLTKDALRELARRNAELERQTHEAGAHDPPSPAYSSGLLSPLSSQQSQPEAEIDWKDLTRFARHGGPDLSDLRNVCHSLLQEFAMLTCQCTAPMPPKATRGRKKGEREKMGPSAPRIQPRKRGRPSKDRSEAADEDEPSTKKTESTGPFDDNFCAFLTTIGVFDATHTDPKAADVDEISDRLDLSRQDVTVTDDTVLRLRAVMHGSSHKKTVCQEVLVTLLGELPLDKLDERGGHVNFSELQPLSPVAEFGPSLPLAFPQPDYYHGAKSVEVHSYLKEHLAAFIMPTADQSLPVAPNLFVVFQGPEGCTQVAECQARHYGAFGARGIHKLETFRRPLAFDKKIKAITITVVGSSVGIFGTYIIPATSPNQPLSYHNVLLDDHSLCGQRRSCEKGIVAIRNAMDIARTIRVAAIERAKAMIPSYSAC
jgi:hypothetical protein